jgi:hypothetical protein
MSIFKNSPPIVTDGLVLYLDAANTKSYPTTGTTWNDLLGTISGGTLINGPTFNSSNGGSIVFDGVDDNLETNFRPLFSYIDGNNFSLEIWFYLGSSSYSMGLTAMRNRQTGWVWAARSISGNIVFSWFSTGWVDLNSSPSQYIPPAQWNLGNLIYDTSTNKVKFYLNGYYIGELDAGTQWGTDGAPITIPRWDSNGAGYSNPQSCSKYSVYNRALTASEVLQNYNATKQRYNLT